ncbi:hypothetical protein ACSSS7_000397 [Eimeria intestinalis]
MAPSRSLRIHEPSSVSPSFFSSLNAAAGFQELSFSSRNQRLRPRGDIGVRLVLGTIASAAAIAVLIALCAAAYIRSAPLQVPSRRLSEGRPSKSGTGLAACGETGGGGPEDESQVSLQEEELVPPQAKKAKAEAEGSESDAGGVFEPQTSAGGQVESSSAAVGASGGAAASALEAESSLESRFSPEEVIAAQALMALLGSLPSAFPEQAAAVLTLEQQAQLLPVAQQQATAAHPHALVLLPPTGAAAALGKPMVFSASPPSRVKGTGPEPAPSQLATPRPRGPPEKPSHKSSPGVPSGSRAEFLSSNEGLELIDPLGEWEAPPLDEAGEVEVVEHPFWRLPRVEGGNPSAYTSFIDPQGAVSNEGRPVLRISALRELSILLAQEELSRSQLQRMALIAEHLLSHLTFHEVRPLRACPANAAEVLGFRFLALDMAVSALHLLGVPCSGPWWEHMVSRIPDKYNHRFTNWGRNIPKFNIGLLTRLTAAVQILKAGHRPDARVVVHLKRCLFCCKHSPLRFLRPAFDLWREEDKRFYQQCEGRTRQNDPG